MEREGTSPGGHGRTTMERRAFSDDALQAELERRLDVIESPEYEDPARESFGAGDFIAVAALVVVVSVVFLVWGY
jgi:hypothetical protein